MLKIAIFAIFAYRTYQLQKFLGKSSSSDEEKPCSLVCSAHMKSPKTTMQTMIFQNKPLSLTPNDDGQSLPISTVDIGSNRRGRNMQIRSRRGNGDWKEEWNRLMVGNY